MIPAWILKIGFPFIMIITGTVNTISAKFMNTLRAKGTNPSNVHLFVHPLFQTGLMFFGEMLCFFAFHVLASNRFCRKFVVNERKLVDNEQERLHGINGRQQQNQVNVTNSPLIWCIPAFFDLVSTTMLFIALSWTFAPSYQMLRGSVTVFTGVFSVIFLKSKLKLHHWLGIAVVVMGLTLVGLADYLYGTKENVSVKENYVLASDLLIIIAQIFSALQFIIEEHFLKEYKTPPLQAVGCEGVFGFAMVSLAYIIFYYVPWNPSITTTQATQDHPRFEDIADAITMLGNNWHIPLFAFVFVISVGAFNFAGLTITDKSNATTRKVLDNIRIMLIWAISLLIPNWQKFQWKQLLGYVILIVGTNIYYKTYTLCKQCFRKCFKTGDAGDEDNDIDNDGHTYDMVGDEGGVAQEEGMPVVGRANF